MPLTADEEEILVNLMERVEFPVSPRIFDVWCNKFTVNVVELATTRLNSSGLREILLIYRKDKFFDGWHIPGSVILPCRTVNDTISKIVSSELGNVSLSTPIFLNWFEKVVGVDRNLRGQEMSLLFHSNIDGFFKESESAKFFSFDNIPGNLIESHRILIEYLIDSI